MTETKKPLVGWPVHHLRRAADYARKSLAFYGSMMSYSDSPCADFYRTGYYRALVLFGRDVGVAIGQWREQQHDEKYRKASIEHGRVVYPESAHA